MVIAAIPGERWEIEFFPDGSIEVERFISRGIIEGPEILEELLADSVMDDPEEPEATAP